MNKKQVNDMKCALAAVGFINEDSIHNKNVIIGIMKQYAGKADVVIFTVRNFQSFSAGEG